MEINRSPVIYKENNTLSLTFIYRYALYHDRLSIKNNATESYGAAEPLVRAQKVQGPPYLWFHFDSNTVYLFTI